MATYVNSFFETRLQQLLALAELVEHAFASAGLEYRVVGGLAAYLYVEEREPDAGRLTKDIDIAVRRAVHMIFSGDPELGACRILQGVRLAPTEDLIRMQLTSFRLDDEVNLKDLDEAGVITPQIESGLSPLHKQRLQHVRAR